LPAPSSHLVALAPCMDRRTVRPNDRGKALAPAIDVSCRCNRAWARISAQVRPLQAAGSDGHVAPNRLDRPRIGSLRVAASMTSDSRQLHRASRGAKWYSPFFFLFKLQFIGSSHRSSRASVQSSSVGWRPTRSLRAGASVHQARSSAKRGKAFLQGLSCGAPSGLHSISVCGIGPIASRGGDDNHSHLASGDRARSLPERTPRAARRVAAIAAGPPEHTLQGSGRVRFFRPGAGPRLYSPTTIRTRRRR